MKKKEEIKKIDIKKYLTQIEVSQAERIAELEDKIEEFQRVLSVVAQIESKEGIEAKFWLGEYNKHFGIKIEAND